MSTVLDCDTQESELEHQSLGYDHFRTNTIGKGMNPRSDGLNSAATVLQQGGFRH